MKYLLLAALLCSGCDGFREVTGPSPVGTSTVPLTVRVLEYATELPLPADVLVDSVLVGRTALPSSELTVQVPTLSDVTILARAEGYRPSLSAQARVVHAGERWTFYLEREP